MIIPKIERIPILPKKSVQSGIQHYLKILTFLKEKGVFGPAILYPLIGFDFFPALFGWVFGFNNRYLSGFDFFEEQINLQGVKIKNCTQRIKENLTYLPISDAKDIKSLREELKVRGFFEITGRKTLFLKGTFIDLFEKEFDPDTERYYPVVNPLEKAKNWLKALLDLFNPEDHLVAFDQDLNIIPLDRCQEIKMKFPCSALTRQGEFLIDSGETALVRLYLPSQFTVYKIILL